MSVDFEDGDVEREADEEELLLLFQPDQLHLHLPLRAAVHHQEVGAAVVERLRLLHHGDGDGGADAPEGFLEVVQQGQRHNAAVLKTEAERNIMTRLVIHTNITQRITQQHHTLTAA